MKRFITSAFLAATVAATLAQPPVKQTFVMDDGSRITGTIISDSSGYLKIRLTKPSKIVLNRDRVVSALRPEKSGYTLSDYHGYNIKFSAGILAGNSENGRVHSLSIHASNGYQFRNGLNAGMGTGIENLDVVLIPVYADFRYHPLRTRVSPFVWMKGGYAFPGSDYKSYSYYYGYNSGKTTGGILFNAGLGTALYSWRGNAVTMSAGYRTQRIRYKQIRHYWQENSTREVITDFKRFEIQFGFIFR